VSRYAFRPLQVLEVNKDKDLAFALSEYNRVRKPDMDALRYLDTISGRIWGGENDLYARCRTWPWCRRTAKIWLLCDVPCTSGICHLPDFRWCAGLQAAASPSSTSTGHTLAQWPTSWCQAPCTS
jgi:hypothetical protein